MCNSKRVGQTKTVIITLTGDVHVPFVTKHLKGEHIVLDPARFVTNGELTYDFDGNKLVVIYDGKPVTDVTGVWFRRPYIPEPDEIKAPKDYQAYAQSSIRRHAMNLYSMFPDAFWLSEYYTMHRAESKPKQLQVAAELGFMIPATIFTSDKAKAAAFIRRYRTVVAKSLANTLPIVNDRVQHFYTTKITAGDNPNLTGLNLAPSIFQEAIDVAKGLRVTVVGKRVFTAGVQDREHEDNPDITDWRRAYTDGKTRFEKFDLPEVLQDKCVALAAAFELPYGAIDIMLDKEGNYWFLEINPNGQWAFIEDDTGMPIGKAIAEMLESGHV